jgi:hypothetical protein
MEPFPQNRDGVLGPRPTSNRAEFPPIELCRHVALAQSAPATNRLDDGPDLIRIAFVCGAVPKSGFVSMQMGIPALRLGGLDTRLDATTDLSSIFFGCCGVDLQYEWASVRRLDDE